MKPSKEQAERAVRLLLHYIGEDPTREGLKDTPARVIKSYRELFAGYNAPIEAMLNKKFQDISKYKDVVLLQGIRFMSLCEHHMLPFTGTVAIAYIPDRVVVGLSKLARLVDAFARRLQIQERMTAQVADALQQHLNPQGVAVRVVASHSCMTTRGTMKEGSVMETVHFTGVYEEEPALRREFWTMINGKP